MKPDTTGSSTSLGAGCKSVPSPCPHKYAERSRVGVPCNAARKTAPVVAFSISPEDYQSGRYYVVLVFTDRKTMLEYEHEEVKRAGRFEGLCDCLTGYEWCHRPRMDALPIGNILLPRRSLTRSLVAHEILHAACGYAHWAGMKLGRMDVSRLEWRRPVARTSRTEERLAGITENLTRQLYAGLEKHHIFVYRP